VKTSIDEAGGGVPGPKLIRVGKRLVARPTVPPARRSSIDFAALVAEERARWPDFARKAMM
jgi:hypothetical protein